MKRTLVLTFALLLGFAGARTGARAETSPFAHADWGAILRNDPALKVQKYPGDEARYTCVDGANVVAGCYTGGGASGRVDGVWLGAIPIDGMGTGGIMSIRVYEWSGGRSRYLTTLPVYKASMWFAKGGLIVRQPKFANGECDACATQHTETTYGLKNGKLAPGNVVTLPGA